MREKVFVARVRSYDDPGEIADAVRRGLDFLGYVPPARLVGKPNWVLAHDRVARSCYSRPEFLQGALTAIFERNRQASIELIGNSGAGVPTRAMVRRAAGTGREFKDEGAFALERLFPGKVKISPTDGGKLLRYELSVGPALDANERAWIDRVHVESTSIDLQRRYWREVKTSAALLDAEGFVLFPKLKSNVLSHGLTGAIKLQGIGLLLDEARMDGHNYHNHRRMVDMLEVAEPDLIVTDGIEMALGGNQMTERGHPLGIVVVATNAVAHDAVIARILNLRPEEIEHVKIAAERAYGPLWADEIEVGGDVRIGELNARVRSYGDTGFIPVTEFAAKFEREMRRPFPLEVLAEAPWDVAGSHGLVLDWLYMTYDFRERRNMMANWPPATILAGNFHGETPRPSHDRVFVIGDRAIEAWRRLGWGGVGLGVPGFVRALVHGPSRVERFTRPDGGKGTAWLVAGDPPTHRDVIFAMGLGTRFRVRPPLLRWDLILDSYVRMAGTSLSRLLRNLGGVRAVAASSIARLRERKAERAKLLALRALAASETTRPEGWVPPAASPSTAGVVEPTVKLAPSASSRARITSGRAALAPPSPTAPTPMPAPSAVKPPPPTASMVEISALDTHREIRAPAPSAAAVPVPQAIISSPDAPTRPEIAAALDTRPDIKAPAPSARLPVPVAAPASPGEATLRPEIAAGEETARMGRDEVGLVHGAPSTPPPLAPALEALAGETTARVDLAEEAAHAASEMTSSPIIAPQGAPRASPFETTLKLSQGDVDAAVAASAPGGGNGRAAREPAPEPPTPPAPQAPHAARLPHAPHAPALLADASPPSMHDTMRGLETQEMARLDDDLLASVPVGTISGPIDRTAELDEEDDEDGETTEQIPRLPPEVLAAATASAAPGATSSKKSLEAPSKEASPLSTQPMTAEDIAVAVEATRPRGKRRGKAAKGAKGKGKKRK